MGRKACFVDRKFSICFIFYQKVSKLRTTKFKLLSKLKDFNVIVNIKDYYVNPKFEHKK